MNWKEFNRRTITSGPAGQKVLKATLALQKKHKRDLHFYNYPCKVFYVSTSLYWATEQLGDLIGEPMPFAFGLIKDGKVSMEVPMHVGAAERVMQRIEKEKEKYLKNDFKKTTKLRRGFEVWLEKNPIKNNQNSKYYLQKMEEVSKILLNTQIHFQISSHMDELLQRKIKSLFPGIKEEDLLNLCISSQKADVNLHDEKVTELIQWLNKNRIQLTTWAQASNPVKNKILECYKLGYFLHSSYGGVTLWSSEKELEEIKERLKQKIPLVKEIKVPSLKLSSEQKLWVEVSKYFSYLRDRRKSIQQKAFYYQAQLLEEISKYCKIPREELENATFNQIKEQINNLNQLKKIIQTQKKGYLFCWTKYTPLYLESGLKAAKIFENYKVKFEENQQEIMGQVACQGIVKGRVRIIFNTHQKVKFEEGEVLVTGMTSPDFVPLMRKASAIVTDLGGITCHFAIISREFNKPCIVGTLNATRLLRNGDLVEVDANCGRVRKINKKRKS